MTVKVVKIIGSVLLGIICLYFSFMLWIFSVFSGYGEVYTIIIPIAFASIIAILVTWILSKKKILIISLLVFGLCLVGALIQIGYVQYIKNVPIVKEEKIYTKDYLPFDEGSKIALLNEEASLKITKDIPVIDGATALYPVYSAFVNATYPKGIYNPQNSIVLCSTTPIAFENLINSRVDIIFCAEPSKGQVQYARDKNVSLKMTPIGKEAFVFFVNKDNKVSNITSENILSIYSGKITNWKALGGGNRSIKVFQRPKNSGSQTILEKIMGDNEIIQPVKDDIIDGMGGIIEQIADYKNYNNAIGYSFLYYATKMVRNGSIKLLSINNIEPSKESIVDNSYPYTSSFYAITRQESTENAQKLIEWILSVEGQYLIEKTGYVPIQ